MPDIKTGASFDISPVNRENRRRGLLKSQSRFGRLASGAAWSPADITTIAWYDATDAGTITEVAGAVSQWDDKSGNDNHMLQATGSKQPITGTRTHNGLNVLDSDGTQLMATVNSSVPASGDAFIIGVFGIDVVNSALDSIFAWDASPNFDWQMEAGLTNNFSGQTRAVNLGGNIAHDSVIRNGPAIYAFRLDFNGDANNGMWYNGAAIVSTKTYTTKFGVTQNMIVLGALGATNAPEGFVGELIMCEDVTTATRELLETYLANKWGITI